VEYNVNRGDIMARKSKKVIWVLSIIGAVIFIIVVGGFVDIIFDAILRLIASIFS
jgi:hypothetical protein